MTTEATPEATPSPVDDEAINRTVNRRFRWLVWTAVLLVVGVPAVVGGLAYAMSADPSIADSLRLAVRTAGLGYAAVLMFVLVLMIVWPRRARAFGLPSFAGDEREARLMGESSSVAYSGLSMAVIMYGVLFENFACVLIAMAAQAFQLALMIVRNRRA